MSDTQARVTLTVEFSVAGLNLNKRTLRRFVADTIEGSGMSLWDAHAKAVLGSGRVIEWEPSEDAG